MLRGVVPKPEKGHHAKDLPLEAKSVVGCMAVPILADQKTLLSKRENTTRWLGHSSTRNAESVILLIPIARRSLLAKSYQRILRIGFKGTVRLDK